MTFFADELMAWKERFDQHYCNWKKKLLLIHFLELDLQRPKRCFDLNLTQQFWPMECWPHLQICRAGQEAKSVKKGSLWNLLLAKWGILKHTKDDHFWMPVAIPFIKRARRANFCCWYLGKFHGQELKSTMEMPP